ncbi:hypothetical protein NSI01_38870 [Pimelobacter simplex]|nr:hypothetical protein NSI01_38870 [Pimelobacter simplex]
MPNRRSCTEANEPARRPLHKAIFDRLYVDHDGEQGFIVKDTLNEPFSDRGDPTTGPTARAGPHADTQKQRPGLPERCSC